MLNALIFMNDEKINNHAKVGQTRMGRRGYYYKK